MKANKFFNDISTRLRVGLSKKQSTGVYLTRLKRKQTCRNLLNGLIGRRTHPIAVQMETMYAYKSSNGWRCCSLYRGPPRSTQRNGRACLCKQIVQTGTVMVWKLGRGTAAAPLYSAVLVVSALWEIGQYCPIDGAI